MTITPFETNLYQQLAPFFAQHAFVLLPEKKQFRRITGNGFQNIIFSTVFYPNDTMLEVNFGCRNEQIEQIAQQFLNSLPHYRPEANTFLLSIGRFSGSPYFRFKIHPEGELADVCEQIVQFFDTQGFFFMDSVCTLATLDRLFNENLSDPCQYVYNQTHRCYKGLIAARLNYNPRFDSLVDGYRHLLIQLTQNTHEQLHFERLIAYLQHYSVN